ncbi:MAG: hypothetical protein ACREFY_17100 [Acetobacteraceae bacterium]
MSHEYDDPVTRSAVDTAVDLALQLHSVRKQVPFEVLVREAVDAAFCLCVTGAADASVGGRSPVHEGLITEVKRRARTELATQVPLPQHDPVELASGDSFPASDPPAWIWR